VKAQSEVVFDKERNAYMSCQPGSNEIELFGLSEDEEFVDEKDTGDETLRDSQPMQIGKRFTSYMHEAPDLQAENLAHSWRLCPEAQTAQRSAADADAQIIAHSRCLRREDQTARHSAAAITKSSQLPPASPAQPIASRVTRRQGKASAESLTASIDDPFTYAEAMESPQREDWKSAIEEESTSILLNNTFSALNSREARQLQVKPIGSKWVYKTKHNTDGSTRNKLWLVMKVYE